VPTDAGKAAGTGADPAAREPGRTLRRGVAVLSLTTVARPCTGSSDHVAIIDTATDTVVTHGANYG
jgi:hypothetical protein